MVSHDVKNKINMGGREGASDKVNPILKVRKKKKKR